MFKIQKRIIYAIEAVLDIALNAGAEPVQNISIAKRQGIPKRYLEQTLQVLVKSKILVASRGPRGGYILSKLPQEIKLNSILNAVDEKVKTVQCKKESKKGCNGKTSKCITHNLWDELEVHINNFFEQKSLKDLTHNIKENRI